MPCSDGGQRECWEEKYGTNNPDKLRDMLCRIMNDAIVVGSGKMVLDINVEPDIQEWYEKHKEWDKKRKESK